MLKLTFLLLFIGIFLIEIKASVLYKDNIRFNIKNTSVIRTKRDLDECSYNEYECKDGTCVRANSDCDGIYDCDDGSDEAFSLCRNRKCRKNQFRCNYGACIDRYNDVCNKRVDCVDRSDELTEQCTGIKLTDGDNFKCRNGQLIPKKGRCDGVSDCADATDESVAACVNVTCGVGQFVCEYGGCVDGKSLCNGTAECRDGSDERLDICGRLTLIKVTDVSTTEAPLATPKCILPPEPQNGVYRIISETNSSDADYVYLQYDCYPGFRLIGEPKILCWRGVWPRIPFCIQTCPLRKDPSIEYQCTEEDLETPRQCGEEEVEGSLVRASCRQPHYYSPVELPYMQCSQGAWSSGPVCVAECGTTPPIVSQLVLGGETARHGEVPWHAGIYFKDPSNDSYKQICGGSLVSTTVVLSAAHCFWNEVTKRLENKHNYAVAVGKLYRDWDHHKDERFVQKSNAAGWGLTTKYRGSESQELKVIELPYEDLDRCINLTSRQLKHYVVYDKICAGSLDGEGLCRGDSGGGLAFLSEVSGVSRYYLRGVASTSPLLSNDVSCNVNSLTSFTAILTYEDFIKRYL
ncbi:PREDICTED: low-density lipoprotein receptor-related protein 2-like isoform X2 [Papilio polytes]|uniref:low-density lipoprotein receptor-related protein 2-like isoform X2 n=1 Tax=Papilio polytes TaxID=76194 RepID=UPI0006762F7E|nr:PREDICTED: low-density lipoprotein receptor-related protein 2-like isoform X2 [Papilio polytes]